MSRIHGSKITREQYEEGMRRMNVYKHWFVKTVMQVGKFNTFVVMQSEDVKRCIEMIHHRKSLFAVLCHDTNSHEEHSIFNLHGINGGCHRYLEHPKLFSRVSSSMDRDIIVEACKPVKFPTSLVSAVTPSFCR
jgi:hypothetical protein